MPGQAVASELATSAATIVAELGLDNLAVLAAAVYPSWHQGLLTTNDLAALGADEVLPLLQGLDRLSVIDELDPTATDPQQRERQVERLRRMLVTLVEDARLIAIKLCLQVLALQQAKHEVPERRRRLARQTMDIHAPLANRLGIWQLKWQLEDLSLRYLEPEAYHQIAAHLKERRVDRERYILEAVAQLRDELTRHNIVADISGRPKHIYSIWQKLQRKGMDFEQLFDVRAVRVLVDNVATCYAALGAIHGRWRPIPGQFDDYIAAPKDNNYQSLHTAVIGPEGRTLEVQIRTHRMHEEAEYGVAAHWRYKEDGVGAEPTDRRIQWLRRLLETGPDDYGEDLLEQFRAEIGQARVYAITPRGDILDLPQGATALDFAYYVHTDVGHRCRGTRINGALAPLTRPLRTGDRVEILTGREPRPSRDWLQPQLGYLGTARARQKVRQWFKNAEFGENASSGRQILERELQRLGLTQVRFEDLAQHMGYKAVDDLLAALGSGEVTAAQVASRLQPPDKPDGPVLRPRVRSKAASHAIEVGGVGQLMTQIARCCRPLPPEPIAGYITVGRGVSVHRRDCPNLLRLSDRNPGRVVQVHWGREAERDRYTVTIRVEAYDRQGLLRDISILLAEQRINVLNADTHTARETGAAVMDFTIQVTDTGQLSRVLNLIGRLSNVLDAYRLSTGKQPQ